MKKILILPIRMDNAGGTERVMANLANEWSKNYEIHLVPIQYKSSFYKINSKVKIKYLEYKNRYKNKLINESIKIFKVSKLTRKYIKENQIDIVYTPDTVCSLIALFSTLFSNVKVISALHRSYENSGRLDKILKKNFYNFFSKVVTLTKIDEEIYKKYGAKAVSIPNSLTFYPKEKAELKNKNILVVGRFVAIKRYEELISKLVNFFNKYPDWKLSIIGNGPYKKKYLSLIEKHKLEKNIVVIDSKKNIIEEYLKSSIFLLCSKYEGFSLVLLEALSVGVPCISFDCPSGPREIIKNNEDGFLVENGNFDEFINKLEILVNDEELRIRMGNNARSNIKRFSTKNIQKKWDKIIEELS